MKYLIIIALFSCSMPYVEHKSKKNSPMLVSRKSQKQFSTEVKNNEVRVEYICGGKISPVIQYDDYIPVCEKTIIHIGSKSVEFPLDKSLKGYAYKIAEINDVFFIVSARSSNGSGLAYLVERYNDNTIFEVGVSSGPAYSANKKSFFIFQEAQGFLCEQLSLFSIHGEVLVEDFQIESNPECDMDCKNVKSCFRMNGKQGLHGLRWVSDKLITGESCTKDWQNDGQPSLCSPVEMKLDHNVWSFSFEHSKK